MTIEYAFAHEKPERLAGLEATWDPGTQALLQRLGIGPGRRCLEIGAGGGSVAAWMAEQVGPDGHVLATDLDIALLEPLASDVLEVRRHDLLRDPLPDGAFDLIHARSVVSWLGHGDPIPRLVAALRPGGVLLLEDFDWALGGPADDDPAAARAFHAIISFLREVGYDPSFGRTLLARFDAAGLQDAGSEGRSYVVHGGSPGTAFERWSLQAQHGALVGGGRLTQEDFDETLRLLGDPTRHVLTAVLYAAWGRRQGDRSVSTS
jgi:SAM-dependent methyltransferase